MDDLITVMVNKGGEDFELNFPSTMSMDKVKEKVKAFTPPPNPITQPISQLKDVSNPSRFESAIKYVFDNEGELSDNPNDTGGVTKYGISKASYPQEDIKSLTPEKAKSIYQKDFWSDLYEKIPSEKLAIKAFDLAVHAGPKQAQTILQRAINRVAPQETKVAVDGKIGPQTLGVLGTLDNNAVLEAFKEEQKSFYNRLIDSNPAKKVFSKGWVTRAEKLPS